ncbi:MAG: AAA-like domain-containing protein [Chloroflexota bacterium]
MRKFSSYGPVDKDLHYHAPRTVLIDAAREKLLGDDPKKRGHYITVWAPRQTGKSWLTRQVLKGIQTSGHYEVGVISMQSAKTLTDEQDVLDLFVEKLQRRFRQDFPTIQKWNHISSLFTKAYFSKPVVLIIDEFDALQDDFINRFANEFREMYLDRVDDDEIQSEDKEVLLHALALIGVRSVLGIENIKGSPFNIQRSVHIPNLTQEEVAQIFQDYQHESGQRIDPIVIERIYAEIQGQPGLTCWMGEMLTEVHNRHDGEITLDDFEYAYSDALDVQPNNNILNIISKAKEEAYQPTVLEMFQAGTKLPFRYDDPATNYLYMNGVVTYEETRDQIGRYQRYLKFPCPFVQKRLFNYFAHLLFSSLKRLYDPLIDLSTVMTDTDLNIPNIIRLYEAYMHSNRDWLFKSAPRRKTDEHIYEAVYHFNLYMYLIQFLRDYGAVVPEFPTGNGQIDLVVYYHDNVYPLEVKSFINRREHQASLKQAARYGSKLNLAAAWLVTFIETMTDEQRTELEETYYDAETGVEVYSVFVTLEGKTT